MTQAGRAAAEERRTEAAADKAMAKLWPDLATVEPTRDPVQSLARLSGALRSMCDEVGARVNELHGRVAAGEHLQLLRAEVVLLDKLLDKAMRVDGKLADLGLMERNTQVLEREGAEIASLIRRVLDQLGLSDEQRVLALSVVPEEFRRLGDGT